MNSLTDSRRLFWPLVFPLGLGLALVCQLIATTCGLGLTFDSFLYLEGATYFQGGTEGAMVDQPVFKAKPPLFSLLLAVVPLQAMPYLFSILLALNLLILGIIIKRSITSFFYQTIAYLAIAAFTPLLMVHVYLWTEPVFLLFFYGLILILISGYESGFRHQSLIYLALLAIGMVLTRHVSIFFLAGIFIAMATWPVLGWRKALMVLLPALLVFLIWNFGLMADGFNERLITFKVPVAKGSLARLQNIEFYLDAASTWLLPNSLPGLIRLPIFIALIFIGFFSARRMVSASPIARLLIITSSTYYVLMHISFLIDKSSADRYLMPVYPLVIIAVGHLLERSINLKPKLVRLLIVIWLVYPVGRIIKNTIFWQTKICEETHTTAFIDRSENSEVNQE